jgi:hypothetical protein
MEGRELKRVRGLPNEGYRDRKAAMGRSLAALYDGYAAEPIPPEWLDRLDKAAPK